MKMEIQHRGGATVLRPAGALVQEEVSKFRKSFAEAAADAKNVVIDASQLAFADSAGLESLSDAAEDMLNRGLQLGLAGVRDILREILDMTELAPLFKWYDDVEEAIMGLSDLGGVGSGT